MTTIATSLERCTLITMHERAPQTAPQADPPPGRASVLESLGMGPFDLLDVVGNDVSLAIQRELYLEFREPGFAPAPLLEHLVTAGYLGRKTQSGFRDYTRR